MRRIYLSAFVILSLIAAHTHAQTCLGATEVYSLGFEAGPAGWVQDGTNMAWVLTTARSKSGAWSAHVPAADTTTDEALFSDAITVPAGPTQLRFWQWQEIEADSPNSGCFDGAQVAARFTSDAEYQVLEDEILSHPHDGPVSGNFGSLFAGQNAWCGDPRDWTETVVDLTAYSGDDIHVRFQLATDQSVGREGWYIDDVTIETCDPAADSLIAYYPFDGDARDHSGRGNDATAHGAVVSAPGRYGQAYDFSSPDPSWVDLPAGLFDDEAQCSIAYWLKFDPEDPGHDGNFGAVFAHDGFTLGALHANLRLFDDPTTMEFHIDGTERAVAQVPESPEQWMHLAMTYDSTVPETRVYLDGRLVLVQPQTSGELCGNAAGSQIGAWDFDAAGSQDRFYKGLIDDVRIYSSALTAEQVAQLAPELFSDGFESGDLSAWSAVVP